MNWFRHIERFAYDKLLDIMIWVAKVWLILALASNFICVDRKGGAEQSNGYQDH